MNSSVAMENARDRAAPMAAAPFVWRADGRPDWRAMWTTFCDLALFGGPPHRGPAQALRPLPAAPGDPACDPEMLAEIERGILETTGLRAEPGPPGWIALACESPAMAEWIGAAIAPENVEVRVEDDRVLLPAPAGLTLENEVKSLVTVVAKTHHYWTVHRRSVGDGSPRPLRVAVGGTGRAALIEALRRRYGRRRAVVASAAQAAEPTDHAVDLVLVQLEEDATSASAPPVDGTIGVLSPAAAGEALRRGDRALDAWRLLVVATSREGGTDLSRLQEDLARARGGDPVALVDFATGQGIDDVVACLRDELGLDPWRARRG
jgi:hypothetical protein